MIFESFLSLASIKRLELAVRSEANVKGFTHNYYRYPARFSPEFVREVISLFSSEGDLIVDPFVGGGTSAVEALILNRQFFGVDVSPIATFVSQVKTTLLASEDLKIVEAWFNDIKLVKNLNYQELKVTTWQSEGYFKNIPWAIKKVINSYLSQLSLLKEERYQNFAKCIVLKTAQWALDGKEVVPNTDAFREKVQEFFVEFSKGMKQLVEAVGNNGNTYVNIINGNSEEISSFQEIKKLPQKAKLVLTSPPYVGVHILYHQWQVQSRKRTRAPFWIVDALDGHGSGHYTFGHYKSHGKKVYFENARKVFSEIKEILDPEAIVVQLLGFSDHQKFLPMYLEAMEAAGFSEVPLMGSDSNQVKRIWRNVPNRKWYIKAKENVLSSKEVLLIHKIK